MAPLGGPHAYDDARASGYRASAVLALFTPTDRRSRATNGVRDAVDIFLVQRSPMLRQHPGQIALPGGGIEAGETDVEAALREAHEEIGLAPQYVDVLAQLDRVLVPVSGFVVTPVLGWTDSPEAAAEVSPGEVLHTLRVLRRAPARTGEPGDGHHRGAPQRRVRAGDRLGVGLHGQPAEPSVRRARVGAALATRADARHERGGGPRRAAAGSLSPAPPSRKRAPGGAVSRRGCRWPNRCSVRLIACSRSTVNSSRRAGGEHLPHQQRDVGIGLVRGRLQSRRHRRPPAPAPHLAAADPLRELGIGLGAPAVRRRPPGHRPPACSARARRSPRPARRRTRPPAGRAAPPRSPRPHRRAPPGPGSAGTGTGSPRTAARSGRPRRRSGRVRGRRISRHPPARRAHARTPSGARRRAPPRPAARGRRAPSGDRPAATSRAGPRSSARRPWRPVRRRSASSRRTAGGARSHRRVPVDVGVADLDPLEPVLDLVLVEAVQPAGEAVGGLVLPGDRLVEIGRRHDAEHRTEALGQVERAARRDTGLEPGRPQPAALVELPRRRPASSRRGAAWSARRRACPAAVRSRGPSSRRGRSGQPTRSDETASTSWRRNRSEVATEPTRISNDAAEHFCPACPNAERTASATARS